MILDWKRVLNNVQNLLSPNGYLAISDFSISPKQSLLSKLFWKNMFSVDGVYLNSEHWKYTDNCFEKYSENLKLDHFHQYH